MKLKGILKAVKIGIAVTQTLVTGKVANTLKDAGVYIDLTEGVVRAIEKAAKDVKK